MKRLLTFLFSKLNKQALLTINKPDVQLNEPVVISHGHVLPPPPSRESVTLNDFLRMSRKATQDIEQRRQEDRERDLIKIENLMRLQRPNTDFPYPHI